MHAVPSRSPGMRALRHWSPGAPPGTIGVVSSRGRQMGSPRFATLALAVLVALSACAADDPGTTPDATASPVAPTPDASPTADDDPSPEPSPDATASPEDLAGEPFDGPPLNGSPAALDVIGVAADDVLNVRAGPGTDAAVVTTLDPLATEVAATGRARLLPGSIWLEVEVGATTGWANGSFLAFLGATDDITARILEDAGARPSAPELEELATDVAALVASDDPPSRVVVSDGPSVGDLGEVTVDVVGLGDDAQRGFRLVVFAEPDGDGWSLRTVEATSLCGRGTTVDGLCV